MTNPMDLLNDGDCMIGRRELGLVAAVNERDQLKAENARLKAERDAEARKVAQMRAALADAKGSLDAIRNGAIEADTPEMTAEVCYTLVCAEHIPPSIENALALPVSEAERKAGE